MLSSSTRSAPASSTSASCVGEGSTSTSTGTSGNAARTALERRADTAGRHHVVVLDQRGVGQGHAVVDAAAAAHRVLLQRAQPRGRLAGVADARPRCRRPHRPRRGSASRRRTGGRAGSARCARPAAGRAPARRPAAFAAPTSAPSSATARRRSAGRRRAMTSGRDVQPGQHAAGARAQGRPATTGVERAPSPRGHVARRRGPRPARASTTGRSARVEPAALQTERATCSIGQCRLTCSSNGRSYQLEVGVGLPRADGRRQMLVVAEGSPRASAAPGLARAPALPRRARSPRGAGWSSPTPRCTGVAPTRPPGRADGMPLTADRRRQAVVVAQHADAGRHRLLNAPRAPRRHHRGLRPGPLGRPAAADPRRAGSRRCATPTPAPRAASSTRAGWPRGPPCTTPRHTRSSPSTDGAPAQVGLARRPRRSAAPAPPGAARWPGRSPCSRQRATIEGNRSARNSPPRWRASSHTWSSPRSPITSRMPPGHDVARREVGELVASIHEPQPRSSTRNAPSPRTASEMSGCCPVEPSPEAQHRRVELHELEVGHPAPARSAAAMPSPVATGGLVVDV